MIDSSKLTLNKNRPVFEFGSCSASGVMILTFFLARDLVAALVALRILYTIVTGLCSPLRRIPGPLNAHFTKLWYFIRVGKGNFHHENINLHRKYGPLVRLGPNFVSVDDPSAVKTIYGITSKFPKSAWYQAFMVPGKYSFTLFGDQDIRRHADSRKRFQNVYSMSSLMSYETYVDQCADIFAQRLSEIAASGRPVDMAHWLQAYAFDVIACITFGGRFGFLDSGEDIRGMMSQGHGGLRYASLAGIFPWLHRWFFHASARLGMFGSSARMAQLDFVQRRMAVRAEERKLRDVEPDSKAEAEGVPRDFMDRLWDQHDRDPEKVSKYHIFMMNLSNVAAGSDTTASTLSGMFYHLLTNPRVLAKLKDEIADFTAKDQLSKRPTFKESQLMPYLDAVMKESLRLHSAVGLPLWREVPEDGVEVAGQYIPAGTDIGINAWVAHRNREVWGHDAEEFRPERWLEAQAEADAGRKETLQRMEAYYLPFGLGSRTCIGRHISILEILKLVPRMLRDFDFELERPQEVMECDDFWFVLPRRLSLRVREGTKSF